MSSERPAPEAWSRHLAAALRQIRRSRGLTTAEAAALMQLDRRNYANFEAGKGRLNVARILRFAEVTDSDPWAILAGVLMGSPRLARDAADNKLVMVFLILLAEFEGQFGEGIRTLDTADGISAFREAFRVLEASLTSRRERLPADWLKTGSAKVGMGARPSNDEDATSAPSKTPSRDE
jgi:transcriptional regulator with XRE-family HTH domain